MSIDKDRKLVKKAQRDPKQFERLYTEHQEKIYRFVRAKVSDDAVAQDLTSTVFEKALSGIASFRWKGVHFGAWLYRIARNTVYDHYRSARQNRTTALSDESEPHDKTSYSLEEEVLHDEHELRLFTCISRLDSKDQYLVYFRYFEGMSIREIAEEVGQSEANIATRLHRIRSLLKKHIAAIDY